MCRIYTEIVLLFLVLGLGKTFIAAVVMYNFQRWYPQDLIIFMAPTRPLVTQQLEACHNIVGIHPSKTVELTGQIVPKKREELWRTKSVFFLTPQVMTSDLGRGVCPAEKVRCIVVDEAHKALGQHAYAQVISILSKKNPHFRVLALSATPGSDLAAVKQVSL
jgi:Fanconi anemia group M protein